MKLRYRAILATLLMAPALLAWSGEPSRGKRDDSASEKLGMKLSLQCWTFNRLSFFEAVDKAAELGIKYVEAYPGQKLKPGSKVAMGRNMNEEAMGEVKKKLADAGGLKLVAFGVDGIPTDEQGARKTFEWAKKMGIEVLVTETTPNETIDKLSSEFNIKVALHNHPNSWPPEKVLKACKDKGKLIGACGDNAHWMHANFVPVDALKKLEGRILHLHLNDVSEIGSGGHDVAWGTGKADIKGMMAELKRQGFNGYLSIEFEYGDLRHLAANLPKCVEYFDKTASELAK